MACHHPGRQYSQNFCVAAVIIRFSHAMECTASGDSGVRRSSSTPRVEAAPPTNFGFDSEWYCPSQEVLRAKRSVPGTCWCPSSVPGLPYTASRVIRRVGRPAASTTHSWAYKGTGKVLHAV